ncbi:MAG: tRNA (adenosine(37)-N6)-threonylcarbamoyltransferase complex dimerization subunit type 1 TsaB [Pseudomonadota bacterium]
MKLLAFDTSTDVMSIALTDGARTWQHTGPGGAKASLTLIPAILALLEEAGLRIDDLDAIAFGRGPGSFTGLRTACSVAQGLAFGARQGVGIPVLPVDTLMALAEEARFRCADSGGALHITALLDARMDELYTQDFVFDAGVCKALAACRMVRPENLAPDAGVTLAGNVFGVYADRLPAAIAASMQMDVLPTATAMLRLAPALVAAGQLVDAALALPLYVRDKVALTTDERAVVRQQKEQAALAASS